MDIQLNASLTQFFTVNENQTAKAFGSGNLAVFATPSMIACMENTAMKLLKPYLQEGQDSVGTEIAAKHLKASAVGENILFEAKITAFEGKEVRFEITATNQYNECIGKASHTRFIIDVERFMAKLMKQ